MNLKTTGLTWGDRQTARLETLSDFSRKRKSRRYDRRRFNGDPTFGQRTAEARSTPAAENDPVAKVIEEQAEKEYWERFIADFKERSRIRYGY